MEVTDLKCWWKEETLMFANSASSSTFMGWEKLVRNQDTASAIPCTLDSERPIWATRTPMGLRSRRIRISSITSGASSSASPGCAINSINLVAALTMLKLV